MRALKTLLIILLAVVALAVILGLMGPKSSTVSRSVVIHAKAPTVFAHANSLQHMQEWSPWSKKDTDMEVTYSGEEGMVGQTSTWSGNADVGKGKQEITAMVPDKNVDLDLTFIEPFAAVAKADLDLEAMGDSTKATWTFSGENGFFSRIFLMFNDMDKMVGPDFQDGLLQLKALSETDAVNMAAEDAAKTYRGYRIETVERPEMTYAGKRDVVKWEKLGAYFGKVFPQSAQAVEKANVGMAGAPSALYYKWDTVGHQADVFAGVPIQAASDVKVPGCEIVTVPASNALMIVHTGRLDGTGTAHEAMDDMMTAKGLHLRFAAVEEYVTDPAQEPDTSKWVTNICYPVE